MKIRSIAFFGLTLGFAAITAQAQFGAPAAGSQGIRFNGAMAKVFADHRNFSAGIVMEMKGGTVSDTVTMPGHLDVAEDKSAFTLDTTLIKSASMPEGAVAQMKAMGMDKMVMISRPDKKFSYVVYPNLKAYAAVPMPAKDVAEKDSDFKMETTPEGKEIVEGHPCEKVKAVLTDGKGNKQEMHVWKASDLSQFPVKLEKTENETLVTMTFKNVKLAAPEAKLFDPPAELTKYNTMQELMSTEMAKKFGQGAPGK